eukprot:gnl/TRDRNA2_/TRDRNA2_171006_c0_seq1.p1 gnl/TRDRNA2_/TRDRNA2_171006_c0~~gnl/TRDRNA2_/TRDRNA2_171006_c0_seq1.p1  ORF type:complete len:218 (+),score=27.49 gnl/TRDRNA2_/TRDRNA2_171006_c0_seq1:24-677(+)
MGRCFCDAELDELEADDYDLSSDQKLRSPSRSLVDATSFYESFPGHPVEDLEAIHRRLLERRHSSIIFLAGDSTLDNHSDEWVGADMVPAENGYEATLSPPCMRRDVCYWMNERLRNGAGSYGEAGGSSWHVINTAVEESTIAERMDYLEIPQDCFIRDRVTEQDVIVVSVGGNDVAMAPSFRTIINMLALARCTCTSQIDSGGLHLLLARLSTKIS